MLIAQLLVGILLIIRLLISILLIIRLLISILLVIRLLVGILLVIRLLLARLLISILLLGGVGAVQRRAAFAAEGNAVGIDALTIGTSFHRNLSFVNLCYMTRKASWSEPIQNSSPLWSRCPCLGGRRVPLR